MKKLREEALVPEHYIVNRYGKKQKVELENFESWFIGFAIKGKNDTSFDAMLTTPVFDSSAHNNLYGRLMTLVEAIIEDKDRQKAVKDLLRKELGSFSDDLHRSLAQVANNGNSSENIYTR